MVGGSGSAPGSDSFDGVTCREVPLDVILPLRHSVLRPGQPLGSARWDGDTSDSTHHFAALLAGEVRVCLTMLSSMWDGEPAWQLRGMATATSMQRRGLGALLLRHACSALASERSRFWCNARETAIPFYAALGWNVASEPFEVPGIGPHRKMTIRWSG